jgi:hypothetical protein
MSGRTFKVTEPPMMGKDVAFFQQVLNARLRAWDVAFQLDVDAAYGETTAEAAQRVAFGLGISLHELADGVSPGLQIRLRYPERRNDSELAVAREREGWLRQLREHYDTRGPEATIATASKPLRRVREVIARWRRRGRVAGRLAV